MRRLLYLLLITGCTAVMAAPGPKETQERLRAFVTLYKSAKTHRDLIRNMPTFTKLSEKLHERMLGAEIDKPLPRLDFDFDSGTVAFDGLKVRAEDLGSGKFRIDGREFSWKAGDHYYRNFVRLQEMLNTRKTSALGWLTFEAHAQNRSFFPDDPPPQGEEPFWDPMTTAMTANGAAGAVGYVGSKAGMAKNVIVKGGLKSMALGKVASAAYLAYYAVGAISTGVAFAEGAFQPSCDEQIRELKLIMIKNNISMSGAYCRWMGNRESNMSFFTPDGKNLPFIVNWETGTLSVDGKEIYSFGSDALSSVYTREGKTISEGPKFEEYKKNLEPYRKVLHYIGSSRTCFKCGAYVQNKLPMEKPGRYTFGDDPSAPTAAESSK